MSSRVARVDSDLKDEIRRMQEKTQQDTGRWIGEAKALNIIMGREKL